LQPEANTTSTTNYNTSGDNQTPLSHHGGRSATTVPVLATPAPKTDDELDSLAIECAQSVCRRFPAEILDSAITSAIRVGRKQLAAANLTPDDALFVAGEVSNHILYFLASNHPDFYKRNTHALQVSFQQLQTTAPLELFNSNSNATTSNNGGSTRASVSSTHSHNCNQHTFDKDPAKIADISSKVVFRTETNRGVDPLNNITQIPALQANVHSCIQEYTKDGKKVLMGAVLRVADTSLAQLCTQQKPTAFIQDADLLRELTAEQAIDLFDKIIRRHFAYELTDPMVAIATEADHSLALPHPGESLYSHLTRVRELGRLTKTASMRLLLKHVLHYRRDDPLVNRIRMATMNIPDTDLSFELCIEIISPQPEARHGATFDATQRVPWTPAAVNAIRNSPKARTQADQTFMQNATSLVVEAHLKQRECKRCGRPHGARTCDTDDCEHTHPEWVEHGIPDTICPFCLKPKMEHNKPCNKPTQPCKRLGICKEPHWSSNCYKTVAQLQAEQKRQQENPPPPRPSKQSRLNAIDQAPGVNSLGPIPTYRENHLSSTYNLSPPNPAALNYKQVVFQDGQNTKTLTLSVLFDSGAAVNVVSYPTAQKLYAAGILPAAGTFTPPRQIAVATNQIVTVEHFVTVHVRPRPNAPAVQQSFYIIPNSAHEVIFGLPALKSMYNYDAWFQQLGNLDLAMLAILQVADTESAQEPAVVPSNKSEASQPTQTQATQTAHVDSPTAMEAFIEYIPTADTNIKQIRLNVPLLDKVQVLPHRTPPHNRSVDERKVIREIVRQKEAEGKVQRITASEAKICQALVLVDKQASKGKKNYAKLTPEEIRERFRITLDCRPSNAMTLHVDADNNVRLAGPTQPFSGAPKKGVILPYQYQRSGPELIASRPANTCNFMGKIDISDAFSSVLNSPGATQLYCFELTLEDGSTAYYKFNVLPQGAKWSPALFRIVSNEMVDICTAKVITEDPSLKDKFCILFLQDDILVSAETAEICDHVQQRMIDTLRQHSFKINDSKVQRATEHITFIGFDIHRTLAKPAAQRHPITKAFADALWSNLNRAKTAKQRLKAIQKITGHFNFTSDNFDAPSMEALSLFHKAAKNLYAKQQVDIEDSVLYEALLKLTSFVIDGIKPACLAQFPKTYSTILIVDANKHSWGAHLVYLVELPQGVNPSHIPALHELKQIIQDPKHGFPDLNIPEDATLTLIPIRTAAGTFSKQESNLSSTYRERAAQIEAVRKLRQLFNGPTVILSDNENCRKEWHDIEDNFTGTQLRHFQMLQQYIHSNAWLPRESIPAIADTLARAYDTVQQASKSTEPTPVNNIHAPSLTPNTSFRTELQAAYLTDPTDFNTVPMAQIYRACVTMADPNADVEPINNPRAMNSATRHFTLHDGLLYRKFPNGYRIYIPSFSTTSLFPDQPAINSRAAIIHFAHNSYGAHTGITKTTTQIGQNYWWPNVQEDVSRILGNCHSCLTHKAQNRRYKGPLGSTSEHAERPGDCWIVDFTVCPISGKQIIMFVDAVSHFAVSALADSADAKTVATTFLLKVFCQHGATRRVHSDRGTEFANTIVQELANTLGFEWTLSPGYLPRAQGVVEQAFGPLKTRLLCSRDKGIDAVTALSLATYAHNTTVNRSLGLTPFAIMFNRDAIEPKPAALNLPDVYNPSSDIIRQVRLLLLDTIRADNHATQQMQYDERAPTARISVGDLVMLNRNTNVLKKPTVTGPFKVVARAPDSTNLWILSKEQCSHDDSVDVQETQGPYPELHLIRLPFLLPDEQLPISRSQEHTNTSEESNSPEPRRSERLRDRQP
jgi:hypothetical protein